MKTNIILPEMSSINTWVDEARKANKILALLIAGDSNAGKDSRINQLTGFEKIISCTTRPPRKGEKEGVDYYFLSEDDFLHQQNEFLEYTNYGFYYYGVKRSEFLDKISQNKNCVITLDLNGIIAVDNELDINHAESIITRIIYYRINEKTFLNRIKKAHPDITQDQIDSLWTENQIAHLKIKNNKHIDLIIDCDDEIESFITKSTNK